MWLAAKRLVSDFCRAEFTLGGVGVGELLETVEYVVAMDDVGEEDVMRAAAAATDEQRDVLRVRADRTSAKGLGFS